MQATSKREAVSYNFHSLADIEQETDLELRKTEGMGGSLTPKGGIRGQLLVEEEPTL